jgi:hypothetical protein
MESTPRIGDGATDLQDAVGIATSSPPSLKPLQDLLNELSGAIDSRTVSHLTQVRDVA